MSVVRQSIVTLLTLVETVDVYASVLLLKAGESFAGFAESFSSV